MTGDQYLAIIAPDGFDDITHDLIARARRTFGLDPKLTTDRLAVLTTPVTESDQLGPNAIAVGRLVAAAGDRLNLAAEARRSAGRLMVEHCWGDYIVLIDEPDASSILVIRSPSGGLAAFRTKVGNCILISSAIDWLVALGIPVVINWRFVAQHLAFPHLRGAMTGIEGIEEIFAGDCEIIRRGGRERVTIWSPWRFANPDQQIDNPAEARALVHDAVVTSVAALASGRRSILLELSGGLDSSIVAAALAAANAPCSALNLATPGAEGDERRYARATATHVGIGLTEAAVAADLDLTEPVAVRTARPGLPAMLRSADRHFAMAARTNTCDAFFSGAGGDCVFCAPVSATPAADAWLRFGPRSPFWKAINDLARIYDASHVSVMRAAWREARRRKTEPAWPRAKAFVAAQTPVVELPGHPWLAEPAGMPPGKRHHVRAILATLSHLDGYGRQQVAPSLFPLLSQPVIEACLRIPTWLWVDGGHDRAIARQAFRGALPDLIVERRTKGVMDAFCARIFERNRDRLRPFLLHGHCAAHGLLDTIALGAYLESAGGRRDERFYDLLPIIDTEAWLRGWLGEPA